MNLENQIAIVAAAISLCGMCVTIYMSYRTIRTSSLELKIQNFNLQQSYRGMVIAWANEVVSVLSECTTLCELDPQRAPDFFSERNRLRTRLSELIDRGRWFFENDKSTGYGQWKRGANQGIAPRTLSIVKSVLKDHVEKINYREVDDNRAHREPIVQLKKDFVDEIQQFVRPDAAHSELEAIRRDSQTTRGRMQ